MYVDKGGDMPEATNLIKANLLKHMNLQYNGKIFLVHLHMPNQRVSFMIAVKAHLLYFCSDTHPFSFC